MPPQFPTTISESFLTMLEDCMKVEPTLRPSGKKLLMQNYLYVKSGLGTYGGNETAEATKSAPIVGLVSVCFVFFGGWDD